jgi:hypothetical protein
MLIDCHVEPLRQTKPRAQRREPQRRRAVIGQKERHKYGGNDEAAGRGLQERPPVVGRHGELTLS